MSSGYSSHYLSCPRFMNIISNLPHHLWSNLFRIYRVIFKHVWNSSINHIFNTISKDYTITIQSYIWAQNTKGSREIVVCLGHHKYTVEFVIFALWYILPSEYTKWIYQFTRTRFQYCMRSGSEYTEILLRPIVSWWVGWLIATSCMVFTNVIVIYVTLILILYAFIYVASW